MNAPRGRSVADADRDVRLYLIRVAGKLGDVLGEDLTGLYVHGSLATGAYHRERSSIDLIAIVARKLTQAEREAVARALLGLSDSRPTWGDIEVAVLQERYARNFAHPLPYEVRYGSSVHEAIRLGRVDYSRDECSIDLAARFLESRERGLTLVGPPAASLFGPVPWYAYVNALEADFNRARRSAREMPVRALLDACRVLHGTTTTNAMNVLNKDEAGVWALETVPSQYRGAINDALRIYRGAKSPDDVVFAQSDIAAFHEYVRERAQPAFTRACDGGDDEE